MKGRATAQQATTEALQWRCGEQTPTASEKGGQVSLEPLADHAVPHLS